jgi:hypothetical protein
MLGRHPLQGQLAAAAWAARRQPDRHDLVDVLGWAPLGAGAVGRARPAPRPLGVGHRVALGERGGLALGRPAQRLYLTAQPLVGLLEPFALGPQPLVLHAQPLVFGLRPLLLLAQRGVFVLEAGDAPLQRRPASQLPDGDRTHRHRRHKTRKAPPAHPPSRTRHRNYEVVSRGVGVIATG